MATYSSAQRAVGSASSSPPGIRGTSSLEGTPKKNGRLRTGHAPVQQQINVGELEFDFGLPSDNENVDAETDPSASAAQQTAPGKLSTKKKEALSQVPCKFFRSNGCSAGNSCPFAHISPGESSSKAVCQWFLKGNCRFGHKCALAHVLPGQPLSMDRKNKRAQQHQGQGHPNAPLYQQMAQRSTQPQQAFQVNGHMQRYGEQYRGNGYGGETVPDFGLPNGDNAYGAPDDLYRTSRFSNAQQSQDWTSRMRNELNQDSQNQADQYGNIAPSTSTPSQIFGTSPFSHPGSLSVFYSEHSSDSARPGHGVRAPTSFSGSLRAVDSAHYTITEDAADQAELDDADNAEEFLPSSLSDLLTPTELERRRRSVLTNHYGVHSGSAVGMSSQSVPRSGFGSNAAVNSDSSQTLQQSRDGSTRDENQRAAWNKSSNGMNGPQNAQWSSSPRFGASNTSTGFLSSRLREELRSDEAIVPSNANHNATGTQPFVNDVNVALQHVPGQSLPQGLAAGLSRLHLRSSDEGNAATRDNASLLSMSRSNLLSAADGGGQNGQYGAIGGASSSKQPLHGDELGPTVSSSIFAQRNTPLSQQFARRNGQAISASTSFDSPASPARAAGLSSTNGGPLSTGRHETLNGSFNASPALSAQHGGIAIPSNVGSIGDSSASAKNAQQRTSYSSAAAQQQKAPSGVNRVRQGHQNSAPGMSPFSLPTTGEEVEEAIFELE